jgi:hypothetical protein
VSATGMREPVRWRLEIAYNAHRYRRWLKECRRVTNAKTDTDFAEAIYLVAASSN